MLEISSRFCQNAPFQDFTVKKFREAYPPRIVSLARMLRALLVHNTDSAFLKNHPRSIFFSGESPEVNGYIHVIEERHK